MIQFFVHMKPIGKARARKGGGHFYTPAETQEAEDTIGGAYLDYRQKHDGIPSGSPLAISIRVIVLRPASAKGREYPIVRPDIDNYEKLVFDALAGLAYKDDACIVSSATQKNYTNDPDRQGFHIDLWEMPTGKVRKAIKRTLEG